MTIKFKSGEADPMALAMSEFDQHAEACEAKSDVLNEQVTAHGRGIAFLIRVVKELYGRQYAENGTVAAETKTFQLGVMSVRFTKEQWGVVTTWLFRALLLGLLGHGVMKTPDHADVDKMQKNVDRLMKFLDAAGGE